MLWEEDHRQPLVAIEVRILGGLRGEGAYLGTGITHAIEHMLFKGTTSRAPGMIDQEVRRYGGTINAFTAHDATGINLFVASAFLPDALGMVADVLWHATFPDEEFAKEREVIISEIQMNLDDPDRRLSHLFWNRHFLVHPYRHPILGYLPLLKRLTAEDLRTLYRAQYVPNNVVVACVGDLDGAAFPHLVTRAFSGWPRGAPYQITVPTEPPAMSPRTDAEELPVQAAYVLLGFPSVRVADPDLYALDVLATIVGQGRSSRLYEALVRQQQLVQTVGASNYTPQDPGVFMISMRTAPAQADAAVAAAQAILDAVAQHGVTGQELKKAQQQVIAGYVFGHETIEAIADDLADSYATTGDPEFSARYVEGVQRVTLEQLQRVARRYFEARSRTVVMIRPPAQAGAPAAPRQPSGPAGMTKTVLPNGLTVLVGVDRHLPMAVITLVGRGGVRAETEQTQGVSNLVAQLLTKGTSHKSASQIAEWVESRGGRLEAFSGRDGFGLILQVLASDAAEGLDLVHEFVTDAVFPEAELDLQRQLALKELTAREDDIFDVGSRLLRQTLFASHPYRFDPLGTAETVSRVTRRDCQAFAAQWLAPGNLVLAISGDVQPGAMLEQVRRRFAPLPKTPSPWPQTLPAEPLDRVREASRTVSKEQCVIFIGFRGTQVTAKDRDALDVLTAVLSGMSGRLFQAVREAQGLAYTLGALNVPGWDRGYLAVYAATRPVERAKVLRTIETQLQAVIDTGVTADEVEQAKRYLIGAHRMDLQQLAGVARQCALDELYGLGYEAWRSYEPRLNAITPQMVQAAAKRYLTLSQRAEVVVGPLVDDPVLAQP